MCFFCFYVFSVFIAIMCLLMCVCRILIKITYLLTYLYNKSYTPDRIEGKYLRGTYIRGGGNALHLIFVLHASAGRLKFAAFAAWAYKLPSPEYIEELFIHLLRFREAISSLVVYMAGHRVRARQQTCQVGCGK